MLGAAAEDAQPHRVEVDVVHADDLADVLVLGFHRDVEAAPLHQRDLEAVAGQAAGEGDAGRAGADDADVELTGEAAALALGGVKEHG